MESVQRAAAAFALAAAAGLLAACGSSGGSGSAHAAASSIAANPSVKADEQAAVKLIQGCLSGAHIADVKGCIEDKFSPDARTALGRCLAKAAASSIGTDAKAKFAAGAQSCVATALEANTVSPAASIPGITPSASKS